MVGRFKHGELGFVVLEIEYDGGCPSLNQVSGFQQLLTSWAEKAKSQTGQGVVIPYLSVVGKGTNTARSLTRWV